MDHDPHTLALHADDLLAELPDVAPAIRPSSTFEHAAEPHRTYRRDSHETVERLEAVLGALDLGTAVAYPSGMAAIAAVLRRLRPARIALPEDVYHGTAAFVNDGADRGDWEVVDAEALGAGDVWWLETPSNPRCLITDVEAAVALARARGVVTVVDATFATPVLMQPLRFGADVVVHSSTKFVAGHSDAMGGVVVAADDELAAALHGDRTRDGAIPGSLDSWLTLRGVRTLPIRVERQCATAGRIAEWLLDHVDTVWYPGLAGHPGHEIAAVQMAGFGAVVSFEVDPATAAATVERLHLFRNATSLGGVESLAEHRLRSDPTAPPGLIRLSVGLEAPQDLIADLERALGMTG